MLLTLLVLVTVFDIKWYWLSELKHTQSTRRQHLVADTCRRIC